jgi:ATP-dependent 26S proteasome regulatory subunit
MNNTIDQNNLAEALSMRYPTVWAHCVDTVECIADIKSYMSQFKELDFYIFNAIEGLQIFNYTYNRYHTVHTQVENPMTGEKLNVPIEKFPDAINYLYGQFNSTLIVPNAEQFADELNDMIVFANMQWRNSWETNDSTESTVQFMFTSQVQPNPPEGVSSQFKQVFHGMPSREDFIEIATHIADQTNKDLQIPEIATASVGLGKYEAIQLYHSQIARNDDIDVEALELMKFQRIAQRSNLEMIKPQVDIDDVAGSENLKKILEETMWLRNNPDQAKAYGIKSVPHRFLMLGLAGTGKSFLCEASAKYLNLNLVRTGMTQQLSKFHGESENNTREAFQTIASLDPVCVWIDELGRDAAGGQSSHLTDGGTTSRQHGLFLTAMQELASSTYLFAAANDISTLAPEMLRADRFDKIFFVGFPTMKQRFSILEMLLRDRDHTIDIGRIASITGSFTGAELKSSLSGASLYGLAERRLVNTDDMILACNKDKNRLWLSNKNYCIANYKAAVDQYEWASDSQHAEAGNYIQGNIPKLSSSNVPNLKTSGTMV